VRRPLTPDEFEQVMDLVSKLDSKELALVASAYFSFQLSMMGRLDDTGKFRHPDLRQYPKYEDYAVLGRLCWSKNVREERDAPLQLLFGANDPHYDVLSFLGLWLEYRFEIHPEQNEFVFCVEGLEDPERIKDKIRRILSKIFKDEDFIIQEVGLLGTHSIRKYAVTLARGCGCSKVSVCVCFYLFQFIY
jgi:hypothetical protein